MCVSGGARRPRRPRHSVQCVQAFVYRLYKRARPGILPHFLLPFSPLANQPESKVCVHGYLFPLPVTLGPVPHPSYDATAGSDTPTRKVADLQTLRVAGQTFYILQCFVVSGPCWSSWASLQL